ncbi:MAG: electron transfer flavoprotein subunit alpha/FixB family protein [Pseudomonadota bacterium]
MANIAVYIDFVGGQATRGSLLALNCARRIATEFGATLYALLLCKTPPSYGDNDIIAVLSRHGADKIILITAPNMGTPALFNTHGEAILTAFRRFPPSLVLIPCNAAGNDIGPRLALELEADYGGESRVSIENRGPYFTRLVFGRQLEIKHEINVSSRPTVLTVLEDYSPQTMGNEEAEVIVLSIPDPISSSTKIHEVLSASHLGLAAAKTVLGGGAGLSTPRGFTLLQELATVLNAKVGASRSACQLGLAPPEIQLGINGTQINADVYLAFGISGSPEHLVALSPKTKVVAINNDPNAPIFKIANLGLLADAETTIKEMLSCLRPGQRGTN